MTEDKRDWRRLTHDLPNGRIYPVLREERRNLPLIQRTNKVECSLSYRRYIIRRKSVLCVRDKKTRLADCSVSNDNTFHTFHDVCCTIRDANNLMSFGRLRNRPTSQQLFEPSHLCRSNNATRMISRSTANALFILCDATL